jgi:hypothetical protein
MPYEYLTFNESDLENGIITGSYFQENIQSLYEQSVVNEERYFGLSENDNVELTVYDANQQLIRFDRIIPDYKFSITQGTFFDINGNIQQYKSILPSTNYLKYKNDILLNVQYHLLSSNLSPGLYHTAYNFVRNIAGTPNNRLIIKEISPSRREVKFTLSFDKNKNDQTLLDYVRIQNFAEKKFLFIQISELLMDTVNNHEISKSYNMLSDVDKILVANSLGLKSIAELQEFILKTYTGFSKILKYYSEGDTSTLIEESKRFIGVSAQLQNFIRQFNQTPFSENDILTAFERIIRQVCQDRILQKTTLTPNVLDKCVQLFVDSIFDSPTGLRQNVRNILSKYSVRFYGLFKNAINFDNGNLVKILDHQSYRNAIDNTINVHVKLDEPLSSEYGIKSTCWISNISVVPFYFKVNLTKPNTSRKVFLNGVNFDVNVNTSSPKNELFEPATDKSLELSISNLKNKYNDLFIDYTEFNNFIVYSSAELRTKIAKNKILEYNATNTKKQLLTTSAISATVHISASLSTEIDALETKQIALLNSFDEYESYLFFNTSSIDDQIINGIEYDSQNLDSLNNQLPEYIQNDGNSSDYLIFTSMIGHFFDNILTYIKKFPKTFPLNNDDTSDYPKNYIDELLNSFNWDTVGIDLENSNISKYLLNSIYDPDLNTKSYFEYTKSIYNRFANNLPAIYKSKGTATSFDLLSNIFGIPEGFIKIKEYGSADYIVNQKQHYEYESSIYLTRFDSEQYLDFEYTGSEFSFQKLNEITTSIDMGVNKVTSSYLEKNTGINSVELSFKWDTQQSTPTYNTKTKLLQKVRNGSIDWQISILKDVASNQGRLVFDIHPLESGTSGSICSNSLPIFNGNLYTIAISKDTLEGYSFDAIPPTSASYTVGDSEILAFTASTEDKYLPNKYTLYVAQNEGSYSNFYDKSTGIFLYDQNKYFSSGSYYVGNFETTNPFIGNIDKLKIYKTSLTEDEFIAHSFNVNSISIDDKENLYSNLVYLWSFDTPIDLWSNTSSISSSTVQNQNIYYNDLTFGAHNFTGTSVTLPYPDCTPAITSTFPYQFDKLNINQSLISVTNYGPNYKNSPKITKINETQKSTFVPYDYSTSTNDVIGSDSNTVGYFMSPYSYLELKIEEFLGKDGISNIIGDPSNLNKQEYTGLKKLHSQFSSINKKYIYPQEYYTTFKFYVDFSVFDYVDKLIPNRASLKKGLLLEPSIFERKKINIKDLSINDDANYNFSMGFDNSAKFETEIVSTLNGSNNISIDSNVVNYTTTYPLNYSSTIIYDTIDDRDFIFSKYGKYIGFSNDRFIKQDIYDTSQVEFRKIKNNDGNIISFTSSYSKLQHIGSGSITGSLTFQSIYSIYSGSMGSGYSDRHMSKFMLPCSKRAYKATSEASVSYNYVKGECNISNSVDRKGNYKGSPPIITINGFLSLREQTDALSIAGDIIPELSGSGFEYSPSVLTASLETSSSLETYIYNL